MYLAGGTRPDILQRVSELARFMAAPRAGHWRAATWVSRYLRGTSKFGVQYLKGQQERVGAVGYSDASYASDEVSRRSTIGFVFLLAGGTVSRQTRLQPTVAMSTTEAECMAARAATKEALWLRKLQHDLNLFPGPSCICIKIFGDNQGALALIKNPVHHARSKHIDVLHHAVRERVNRKEVEFEFCPTCVHRT
jgi:hypothetical protein